jgi:hypothetical protein
VRGYPYELTGRNAPSREEPLDGALCAFRERPPRVCVFVRGGAFSVVQHRTPGA